MFIEKHNQFSPLRRHNIIKIPIYLNLIYDYIVVLVKIISVLLTYRITLKFM